MYLMVMASGIAVQTRRDTHLFALNILVDSIPNRNVDYTKCTDDSQQSDSIHNMEEGACLCTYGLKSLEEHGGPYPATYRDENCSGVTRIFLLFCLEPSPRQILSHDILCWKYTLEICIIGAGLSSLYCHFISCTVTRCHGNVLC